MTEVKGFKYAEKKVSELEVSKTNPRFVQTVIDEATAIAQLIKLDTKKMLALTNSIIEKGVQPSMFFTFIEKGNMVLADGNRRLTVIKILSNPDLIPSTENNKALIDLCTENKDKVVLPTTIMCAEYGEFSDDLFEILERLHITDESKSDWTPLAQYRMSSRHGGSKHAWMKTLLFYFDNDAVNEMTDKKADVFRRMFDAMKKAKIQIKNDGEIELEDAKERLTVFAKEITANKINTRSTPEAFDEKVKEVFIDGVKKPQSKYTFSLTRDYIFETQPFDLALLGIKVINEAGKSIKFADDDITMGFKNPAGVVVKDFDSSTIGSWTIEFGYDNATTSFAVRVVKKKETEIILNNTKVEVKQGNSHNLRRNIQSAVNAFGEDVASKVKIKADKKQGVTIENDILSGDTPKGQYKIQYQYKDNFGECSKVLWIDVNDIEDHSPLFGVKVNTKIFSWGANPVAIDFNDTVAELINEINSVNFNDVPNLISCALRSIFELSYDTLVAHSKLALDSSIREFKDKLKAIKNGLLVNATLSAIVNGDKKTFSSFDNERNFLNTFTDEKLLAINGRLNSATHKAGHGVNFDEIKESIKKDISRLVALINQWMK